MSLDWMREHHVHYLYELFFSAIWALEPGKNFIEMKLAWNALWSPDRPHFKNLVSFAKSEVLCWTNRAESRIENKKITFLELADSCASTVASVAIGEVLKVWIEMHLSFAQFLGESQISIQVA